MIITKQSSLTGIVYSFDIPVTQEQIRKWQDGESIQHVMPNLTDDQREFIMTGITPEEWDMFILPDDEDI